MSLPTCPFSVFSANPMLLAPATACQDIVYDEECHALLAPSAQLDMFCKQMPVNRSFGASGLPSVYPPVHDTCFDVVHPRLFSKHSAHVESFASWCSSALRRVVPHPLEGLKPPRRLQLSAVSTWNIEPTGLEASVPSITLSIECDATPKTSSVGVQCSQETVKVPSGCDPVVAAPSIVINTMTGTDEMENDLRSVNLDAFVRTFVESLLEEVILDTSAALESSSKCDSKFSVSWGEGKSDSIFSPLATSIFNNMPWSLDKEFAESGNEAESLIQEAASNTLPTTSASAIMNPSLTKHVATSLPPFIPVTVSVATSPITLTPVSVASVGTSAVNVASVATSTIAIAPVQVASVATTPVAVASVGTTPVTVASVATTPDHVVPIAVNTPVAHTTVDVGSVPDSPVGAASVSTTNAMDREYDFILVGEAEALENIE